MSGQLYRKFYAKEQAQRQTEPSGYHRETTYRTVDLWQKAESPKAYLFSTGSKADDAAEEFWLPKSQIKSIVRQPARDDDWPICRVEVAEWLLNKHDL